MKSMGLKHQAHAGETTQCSGKGAEEPVSAVHAMEIRPHHARKRLHRHNTPPGTRPIQKVEGILYFSQGGVVCGGVLYGM